MTTSRNARPPKTRHRIFLVASIAAAACSLVVATSVGAQPQRSSAVTLRLVTTPTYTFPLGIIIGNFNRVYPDIKIDAQYVPAAQLAPLAQTQFRAGNAPDIIQFVPGYGNPIGMLNYADQGYLLDLAKRPWEKRLTQPELVGLKQGKKLWAASTGQSILAYAYNKDLFSQLGVKVPKTWAEMIGACRKFTAAGKTLFVLQGGDATNRIVFPLVQAGAIVTGADPRWNVKRAHGQVSFANSKWRRVFEQFMEAKNAGCFSPGASGVSGASAIASFARGEGGIYPVFSAGLAPILAINPNIKIGFLSGFPDRASENGVVLQPSLRLCVNASVSGEQKDAALKFIDFIMRPKQTETLQKALGAAFTGYALKSKKFPSWLNTYFSSVEPLLKAGKYSIVPTALWPSQNVFTAMSDGELGLLTGQKTIDQVLADIDAAYNKGRS